MGGGLTGLVIAFALLVVLAGVALVVVPLARRRQHTADVINAPGTPPLDYRVPEGQDPATVLAAVADDGYAAAVSPSDTQLVRVHCPGGPDRERPRVRAIIAHVPSTTIDAAAPAPAAPVVFEDER
ncbi:MULTISPECIES: hypothetical protein [unclassified Nocardioides]|uniref:hypothetical protein n=1 Tax=unclassified Nocardioides TaxID=2615069 RepID=UPI0000EB62AB|nr:MULTISPECIES: hypothetical protein [unclassified Nocardioides]ABL82116.1 hypothetical protein Noca_2613 [Nocardioides sp. JS614]